MAAAANPWNEFVKRYYKTVQDHPVAERAQVLARMYKAKKAKLRPRLMSGRPSTPRGISFNEAELRDCRNELLNIEELYHDYKERLDREKQNAQDAQQKFAKLQELHDNAMRWNVENEDNYNNEIIKLKNEIKLLKEQAYAAEAEYSKRLADPLQKNKEAWGRVAELQQIIIANKNQVKTMEMHVAELQRRLAAAEQAITVCKERAEAAEARVAELQNKGSNLLAVAETRVAELQRAISECKARAEEGEAHVAELHRAISECKARAEAAEAAEARAAELQKEGEARFSAAETRVAELQQAISDCNARADDLKRKHQKELADLSKKLKGRLDLLEKQLKGCNNVLGTKEARVKSLKADNEKRAKELARHMDSIAFLKQQRTELKKKLKSCEKTAVALRRTIKDATAPTAVKPHLQGDQDIPMSEMNAKRKNSSPTLPIQPPRYNRKPRLHAKRASLDPMSGDG
jgi:chromosome segregation ATPase